MAESAPVVLDPPEASPPALVPGFATEVAVYLEYIAIALLVKRAGWEQVCMASLLFAAAGAVPPIAITAQVAFL